MKRVAQERKQALQVWRRHLSFHERRTVWCFCELQPVDSAKVGAYGAAESPAAICVMVRSS